MPNRFPQDFPSHLGPEAEIQPVLGSTPLGSHPLCFDKMNWTQFEQFCWWLLQRDYRIEGCQRIGGTGRAQAGIDLFAYAHDGTARLTVFECKCWENLTPAKLKTAVENFLKGHWAVPGVRFVIILAQDSVEDLGQTWHEARTLLRNRGIDAELWTAAHLTERIRLHPDILIRFFPNATVDLYCNEWMRRVDFWTQLQKAMVDERPQVRKLAYRFLGNDTTDDQRAQELERVDVYENHWSIDTPWTRIDALLPSKQLFSGALTIVVKQPNTSGFTVALSQDWLLKNLLARVGAPADHSYRPFLSGPVQSGENADIAIDLNHARLQIPPEGVASLCSALDRLTPVYLASLRALSRSWDAEYFPFIGRGDATKVAICSLPAWTWQQVLAFAQAHDDRHGDSEWHIFDANPHFLKVFTTKTHSDFELGYHAFIRAYTDIEGLCYGEDVVLTWDPPSNFGHFTLGARHWMPCGTALAWLRDKLLPAVGEWLIASELRTVSPWRRAAHRRELALLWAEQSNVRVRRQMPLLTDDRYRKIGLVATTETLQSGIGRGAPELYLTPDETRALYRAIAVVLEGQRGYVPYIVGRIRLRQECHSRRELIEAMARIATEEPPVLSEYDVRDMLSALLEGLNDKDDWLDGMATELVYTALTPLIQHLDLAELYERHSRWY